MPAGDSCFSFEEEVDSEVVKQGQEIEPAGLSAGSPPVIHEYRHTQALAGQACISAKDFVSPACCSSTVWPAGGQGLRLRLCLRKH